MSTATPIGGWKFAVAAIVCLVLTALPWAQSTDASLAVSCLPAASPLQNPGFESNTASGTVGSAADCWSVPSTNADVA